MTKLESAIENITNGLPEFEQIDWKTDDMVVCTFDRG